MIIIMMQLLPTSSFAEAHDLPKPLFGSELFGLGFGCGQGSVDCAGCS